MYIVQYVPRYSKVLFNDTNKTLMLLLMMIMIMMIMMGYIFAADSIYICYTSDRNVPL